MRSGGCKANHMAIAFVIETKGQSVLGANFTTTGVDTSGGNLIVVVVSYAAGTAPVVTDSYQNVWATAGAEYTNLTSSIQIFYAASATCGTGHTFTCTGGNFKSIAVEVFSGANTAAPKDQDNGASNDGGLTHQPGSITPGTDNQLVVTALGTGVGTENLTVDGGYSTPNTEQFSSSNAYGCSASYLIQTSKAATNPTWTSDASSSDMVAIASFKAAVPAPSSTSPYPNSLSAGLRGRKPTRWRRVYPR